eukprot:Rhum_TRINITY_DN6129_c0_g1::Rhum_TRINITY_DN6129_c0_g1_i1::g.19214::m.19214
MLRSVASLGAATTRLKRASALHTTAAARRAASRPARRGLGAALLKRTARAAAAAGGEGGSAAAADAFAAREPAHEDPPGQGGSEAESLLSEWLRVQEGHTRRVDLMKSSRVEREGALEAGEGETDPFVLRMAFYSSLLHNDLLFFTGAPAGGSSDDESDANMQVFQLSGGRAALCLFTSMERCADFAERFTRDSVEGFPQIAVREAGAEGEEKVESQPASAGAAVEEKEKAASGDVDGGSGRGLEIVGFGRGGGEKGVPLPSELRGAWLNGRTALEMCKSEDPRAAHKLAVLVNPYSEVEVSLSQAHVSEILSGNPYRLLQTTVEKLFGAFIEEYCGDVSAATCLLLSCHPMLDPAYAADAPPVVILVLESSNIAQTLEQIAWGKEATAELESTLTTFSSLHLHVPEDLPAEVLEGVEPFYQR